jgi:hypothetical protein
MPFKPVVLSLTDLQEEDVKLLSALDRQSLILNQILQGQDPLTVAQALQMSETEVTQALTQALEVRTAFYQDSAKQYQTIILARLEEAYRDARRFAYGTKIDPETGEETIAEPNIHWFRVMLGVLQDIQKLLQGHMEANKPSGLTLINQTILMGDDMFEKGKALRAWKDKDIQDLIEGQVIDE